MPRLLPILALLGLFCGKSLGLECYSCDRWDWNKGDCTNRRVQCEPFQDGCTSYVRWRVPEDWTARGARKYEISKGCDTRQGCARRQAATETTCSPDWYNDWACVECCTGDLCNYWVTLGSASMRASIISTVLSILLVFILHNRIL